MHKKEITALFILSLILYLYFPNYIFAEENIAMVDKIIASTFKTIAKTFAITIDINKFKKDNIDRINKMDEVKFKERYTKAYAVIKYLPPHIKTRYRIDENKDKNQIIKNLESLDKTQIFEVIDSLPDKIIADQFKQYLNKKKLQMQNNNIIEQINAFFKKIIKRKEISTPPLNPS